MNLRAFVAVWLVAVALCAACVRAAPSSSYPDVIASVQPKVVKIYGVGGFRGLENYQSGFLVSAEGHVLTTWSHVLDTEYITVTLNDGRRFDAKLLAADPRLEMAVLKIEAAGLPHFNLDDAVEAQTGAGVLAFSNLFGVATGNEAASVLHGVVSVRSNLQARRGAFETPYDGPAYILDAMTNNPGAAGGALTNTSGELLGMLGKELRNSQNNTWLNYAVPISALRETVAEIRAGQFVTLPTGDAHVKPAEALTLDDLGLVLIPDVLERTPPFVDGVRPGSPAAEAGIEPDDLVLFIDDRLVHSCKLFRTELEYVDRAAKVKLTLLRKETLIDVTIGAANP